MAFEDYCAACTYLSETSDYNGKYYCSEKGDVYACDPKCYNFCEAYSRSNYGRGNMYNNSASHLNGSGCYLTTIMCQILNYPDNNYYLDTLRYFRDNIMKKNPDYFPLLLTYDIIGPNIAANLAKDKNNHEIATSLFNNYIIKAVSAIEEDKYNQAINIYKSMTNTLADHYNINTSIIMPNINDLNINNLGHGKLLTKTLKTNK